MAGDISINGPDYRYEAFKLVVHTCHRRRSVNAGPGVAQGSGARTLPALQRTTLKQTLSYMDTISHNSRI